MLLGISRLVWLGHLLPSQVEKLAQCGAELSATDDSYLASAGCTMTSSSILYLSLTKKRSKSFMSNSPRDYSNSSDTSLCQEFQSVISLVISTVSNHPSYFSLHALPLVYHLNKELGTCCLSR